MATPNDGLWRQPQHEKDLSLDDITIVDKSLLKRAVGAMAIGNAMVRFRRLQFTDSMTFREAAAGLAWSIYAG